MIIAEPSLVHRPCHNIQLIEQYGIWPFFRVDRSIRLSAGADSLSSRPDTSDELRVDAEGGNAVQLNVHGPITVRAEPVEAPGFTRTALRQAQGERAFDCRVNNLTVSLRGR